MRSVTHNGREKLTLLELVLQLESDFRLRLPAIRVTPIQIGVTEHQGQRWWMSLEGECRTD